MEVKEPDSMGPARYINMAHLSINANVRRFLWQLVSLSVGGYATMLPGGAH
jgi:hypothetical protein